MQKSHQTDIKERAGMEQIEPTSASGTETH